MRALLFSLLIFSFQSFAQVAEMEYQPRYPTSPFCRDEAGAITLSYYIDYSGKPHKITVEKTDSVRFSRSAIKTLSRYQFKNNTFDTTTKYLKTYEFKPNYKCDKNS